METNNAAPREFTVIVPYVEAPYRTEWHPTEATGPFCTLQRGSFPSVGEAIGWARSHLNGTPYLIREVG